ncbi:DUF1415 domain-containing protein [Flavisolibacter ginsenosidimutans]|uniref:DUF1415 domain-containing protein n=2 Tax=Flavisolibacter ginsenosidimutans TaxID=661481 RepID=A0A5B8UL32_9BACT|nr:DUF1415 domain-containing protein [Flavisolibacter ginsenosidimutans]
MSHQPAPEAANETVVAQTKKWILDVVVGCNFCPFAGREVKRGTVAYEVLKTGSAQTVLAAFEAAMKKLDANTEIETMLLILPQGFGRFADYLKLVSGAERTIKKKGYEGVYQVASFHPQYLFAGSSTSDPANYTNRSPYPMLHLLREDSVSKAIASYPDTHKIPQRNIAFAKEKGLAYMQALLAASLGVSE